jgi:hypothetical protein
MATPDFVRSLAELASSESRASRLVRAVGLLDRSARSVCSIGLLDRSARSVCSIGLLDRELRVTASMELGERDGTRFARGATPRARAAHRTWIGLQFTSV